MANIYVIKNKINDKVYVGATTQTIRTRFLQHMKASTIRSRNYKLQEAVRKLGKENFYIELLEVVPQEQMFQKECEYIEKFNSYHNGYNSTAGGKGGKIFWSDKSKNEVIKKYLNMEVKSCCILAKEYKVNPVTIVRLLEENGIERENIYSQRKIKNTDLFTQMYYSNEYSNNELAEYFEVNEKTITRTVNRLNLIKKKPRKSVSTNCRASDDN